MANDVKLESTVKHWDDYWKSNNLLYIKKTIEILSQNIGLKNKSIIELGAGSGATAIKIAELGGQITCLDYSSNALSLIVENKINVAPQIPLVQGDIFSLPFKSNSYDICFHQGLLEHFRETDILLKEQYRIIKDGGILLIDVPQKFNVYTLKKRALMKRNKWFAGWETEYSYRELKSLLENNGFKVLEGYGRFHIRDIGRIQDKLLGRRVIPGFIEKIYYNILQLIENTPFGYTTAFSLGMIAKKIHK